MKNDIYNEVQVALKDDLQTFNLLFKKAFKTDYQLLNMVLQYILKNKGKQIRPILILLSAKIFGKTNHSTFIAATMIELLHTATLVHDDVVDESVERRSLLSIKSVWKNKIAVLSGDYLLAKGMLVALENKAYQMLEILSRAVKEMSEGELLQAEKNRKINTDEKVYFEIIRKKTASLFGACCSCGAFSTVQDVKISEMMWDIGVEMGMIFQMQDDLIDIVSSTSGKTKFKDIKERKITLPLIYTLKKLTSAKRRRLKKLLNTKKINSQTIEQIIVLVDEVGGIQYVRDEIEKRKVSLQRKFDALPNNDYSQMFQGIVHFIANREY